MVDHSFKENFKYKHQNPYHDKLEEYPFVMRDHEAEEHQGKWNSNVFKRNGPLEVEIGSGFGHFMTEHCAKYPHVNFVGLDYRFKRSFQLARKLSKIEDINFRYLRAKGERIQFMFDESEVDVIYYFFPDPWPKKRHLKKRLFQKEFLEAAFSVLKPQGTLFVKTDHDGYADWMKEVLIENPNLFKIKMETRDLYMDQQEHFLASFQTKFEKIFLAQKVNIKAFELISQKE